MCATASNGFCNAPECCRSGPTMHAGFSIRTLVQALPQNISVRSRTRHATNYSPSFRQSTTSHFQSRRTKIIRENWNRNYRGYVIVKRACTPLCNCSVPSPSKWRFAMGRTHQGHRCSTGGTHYWQRCPAHSVLRLEAEQGQYRNLDPATGWFS